VVALADLMAAYHLQTEAEKGSPVDRVDDLPDRYRAEVEDPRTAFRGQPVLLASVGPVAAGCVVVTAPRGGSCEIKRLWTAPAVRGRGVASGLVEAALAHAAEVGAGTVRLTVWHWRAGAIALYERLGFARVDSWEERDGLVCMQRRLRSEDLAEPAQV
jgi:putative acetyltransferase